MAKRNSKRRPRNGKSKKNRQNVAKSSLEKEKQNQPQSSFEEIAEIFWGTNAGEDLYGQNIYGNTGDNENISGESKANAGENTNGTTPTNANTNGTTSTNANINENDVLKAQQQEILNRLKSLNDAIAAITLTRDNIASIRIEILSNIYFTRQIRPLIDAVNLIAFASSNMSTVAQNITTNTLGDKKEIKNAFKLVYKMNDEVDDMLGALTRRIKLYVAQLDNMDKNCPPFSFDEDSQT